MSWPRFLHLRVIFQLWVHWLLMRGGILYILLYYFHFFSFLFFFFYANWHFFLIWKIIGSWKDIIIIVVVVAFVFHHLFHWFTLLFSVVCLIAIGESFHFFLVFTFIKFPICSFFVGFGNGSGIDDGGGVWADGQLCKLQFPKT